MFPDRTGLIQVHKEDAQRHRRAGTRWQPSGSAPSIHALGGVPTSAECQHGRAAGA
jgi:hypothetical protein